jgi:hypothetical protein
MNGSTAVAILGNITCDSTGRFVAVGRDYTTNAPMYATSTNGSTWTTPALMNGSTTYAAMRAVAVNSSNQFVAVGINSSTQAVYSVATTF